MGQGMKIKMMLIIALTAMSLLLVTTTIRQAQAYNIFVSSGAEVSASQGDLSRIVNIEPAAGR